MKKIFLSVALLTFLFAYKFFVLDTKQHQVEMIIEEKTIDKMLNESSKPLVNVKSARIDQTTDQEFKKKTQKILNYIKKNVITHKDDYVAVDEVVYQRYEDLFIDLEDFYTTKYGTSKKARKKLIKYFDFLYRYEHHDKIRIEYFQTFNLLVEENNYPNKDEALVKRLRSKTIKLNDKLQKYNNDFEKNHKLFWGKDYDVFVRLSNKTIAKNPLYFNN